MFAFNIYAPSIPSQLRSRADLELSLEIQLSVIRAFFEKSFLADLFYAAEIVYLEIMRNSLSVSREWHDLPARELITIAARIKIL